MNKSYYLFFLIVLGLAVSSCGSSKKIVYLQPSANSDSLLAKAGLHDTRIKPKDVLSISVASSEPEASKNYNLFTPQTVDIAAANSLYSQPTLQSYLVSTDGTIDFPSLGKLKVVGLTRAELETVLQQKLKSAFTNEKPIITIRFVNFSVNVLGEVSRPGMFTTTNDRLTILDAIALAGDLTIYGKRDNIKIIRENADGSKKIIYLNLNDENIVVSPGYYLEQNDVVYVEPNKVKARSTAIGSAETLSVSVVSILISVASLVVNILR